MDVFMRVCSQPLGYFMRELAPAICSTELEQYFMRELAPLSEPTI